MTKNKKWWQKEWNPVGALVAKMSGMPPAEKDAPVAGVKTADKPAQDGVPDMKELESKGLLGKFYRHWKNPAFKKQLQAVAARMQADGVNVKDQNAVKAWVTAHQKEVESGELKSPDIKPVETFVRSAPAVGRNDPCPCGSRKKYKKCCANKD